MEETDKIRSSHKIQSGKRNLFKFTAAACICIIIGAIAYWIPNRTGNHEVIQWTENMKAEEYFKYCNNPVTSSPA